MKIRKRLLSWLLMLALTVGVFGGTAATPANASAGELLKNGDYLYFGAYEGRELVWRVLDTDGTEAMLLCETPFLQGQFDASIHEYTYSWSFGQVKYGSSSWRTCDIRTYLNATGETVNYADESFDLSGLSHGIGGSYSEEDTTPSYAGKVGFLNEENFQEIECALLEPTTQRVLVPYTDPQHENGNYTPQLSNYGDDGENAAGLIDQGYAYVTTTDYMYLLSVEEQYRYINCENLGVEADTWEGGAYWLRDPLLDYQSLIMTQYLRVGLSQMAMRYNGILYLGAFAGNETAYIRPACRVAVEYINGLSGAGTKEDPYRLSIDEEVLNRLEYTEGSVYRLHPTELAVTVYKNRADPEDEKTDFVLCKNATIQVGDGSYRTDENGQATIPYPRTGATIALDGYVTRKLTGAQLEATPEVYLQKESDYPVVNAVWVGNNDVLHKTYKLDLMDSGTQSVKVEVDWGSSACDTLALRQNTSIVRVSDTTLTRITWSDYFDVSEKVYIVAINQAGKTTRLPLKLEVDTVLPEALKGYSVSFGDKISFTLGDNAGEFLSGQEINVGVYSPITFECTEEDGKIYIAFGAQVDFSQSNKDPKIKPKQMVLGMKNLYNKMENDAFTAAQQQRELQDFMHENGLKVAATDAAFNVSFGVNTLLFAEGYINAKGEYVFIDGGGMIGADGKVDYSVPFAVGSIPMFFETSLSSSVSATLNQHVSEESSAFTPDGRIDWSTKLSGGLGAGIKKVAGISGGVEGKLTSVWDLNIDATDYYQLRGTVKPYFKAEVAIFDTKPELKSLVDEVLYEYPELGTRTVSLTEDIAADTLATLYDAECYTMREVAADSVWTGASEKRGVDTVLLHNASDGADPQLVRLSDGRLMLFFIDQNPSVSDANGQQLYYAYYDGGQWTQPQLYRSDGTADTMPYLANLGGTVKLAWTDIIAVDSGSTLADAAEKTRIFVGDISSSGAVSRASGLTQTGKLAYQPILCGEGSNIYAIWQENADNDWFGTTGNRIVYSKTNTLGTWNAEQVLYSDLGSLDSVAADVQDGVLHVAYAMDTDGDLNTVDDLEIFLDGVQITQNDMVDSGVRYVNHVLYWYSDGKLMADGETVLAPKTVALSDRFEIIDDNGVKVLLFTRTDGLYSTLYASWCDAGVWGEPIALTDGTEYVYDFAAAADKDGNLSLVLCAAAVDAEAEEPYGENTMRCLTVETGCDLVLDEVQTDGSAYVTGKEQRFDLTVTNRGTVGTQSVLLEVLDESGTVLAESVSQTPIASGETAELFCTLPISEAEQGRTLTIRATPSDTAERNASDNTREVTLSWDDLAVENLSWGFREDNKAVIYAGIVNRGYTAHSNITVNLREGSANGRIVATKTVAALEPLAQEGVSFAVDAEIDAVYYVTIDISDDYSGNDADFAVLTRVPVDSDHTHVYKATVTAPTCTEQGYTTHTCTLCGDSYTDTYVAALGHAWDNGTVTKAPSATENGIRTFTCTRCGAARTEIIPATGGQPDQPCDSGADCPSRKFIDVNTKEWYHPYVDYAVTHGLFGGTSANTFEPETAMTRAMLVTVLWRYEGQPTGYQNTFSDVNAKDGSWYIDAVAWASANGVVNGVGNGKFDPEGKITREQMAAILFRYAQKKGIDTSKRGDLSAFPDANKISDYAKEAVYWTVGEGIINGSDGKLLPQGNATRAQVATILMRYIENIVNK